MYYYYCNRPGCRGHVKSWETCDSANVTCGRASCPQCSMMSTCPTVRAIKTTESMQHDEDSGFVTARQIAWV